jgi:DNA-binding NarL/FixJ family response regulator
MLSGERDFQIVGEADDGRNALELCRRSQPDVVLMDVRMPQMDGLTATRAIKRRFSGISVLVLTMHAAEDHLLEAIKAGAAGYVLKEASQCELTTAIRKVLDGETILDQGLATRLLRRLANGTGQPAEPSAKRGAKPLQPLTRRELEILEHMALGLTNRQIARTFVISIGTVKNHVEHIMAKLGISDRTQAVVRALELGIIAFPER